MGSDAGGFNFDLCKRNAFLEKKGMPGPKAWKTGTTIAGVVFKDGVVLAADTRSTSGSTVADKNCQKIHYMAPNIYCCGAGTAADCDYVTDMISSALELHRYATGRPSRLITAMTLLKNHLFRYQGHIGAALICGGLDLNGPHLYTIYPHGSVDCLPFCTMGSGSLNAMAVMEAGYKDNMTEEEAKDLASRAILSGVMNDLGSGSNVDLCVITKAGANVLRSYKYLQEKTYRRQHPVVYPPGTAPVTKEHVVSLKDVQIVEGEAMDTS